MDLQLTAFLFFAFHSARRIFFRFQTSSYIGFKVFKVEEIHQNCCPNAGVC